MDRGQYGHGTKCEGNIAADHNISDRWQNGRGLNGHLIKCGGNNVVDDKMTDDHMEMNKITHKLKFFFVDFYWTARTHFSQLVNWIEV